MPALKVALLLLIVFPPMVTMFAFPLKIAEAPLLVVAPLMIILPVPALKVALLVNAPFIRRTPVFPENVPDVLLKLLVILIAPVPEVNVPLFENEPRTPTLSVPVIKVALPEFVNEPPMMRPSEPFPAVNEAEAPVLTRFLPT